MDEPEPIVQQSSSSTSPWAVQIPYLERLFQTAGQNLDAQGGAKLNTGATSSQTTARRNLKNEVIPGMRDDLSMLREAMGFGLNGALDVNNNPHLQGTIDAATRPIMQQLTEAILPQITSEAVATGNLGSSRQGIAEGIAGRGALDAIGDVTAEIGSAAYGQGLDTFMQTMGMFPMFQSAQVLPEQLLEAVGATERGERLQGDLFELNQPNLALNNFANLVRGNYGGTSTGEQVQPQGEGGGAGALIGLGAQGAGLATSLGFTGPWGMAAGAGLGILSGLLS